MRAADRVRDAYDRLATVDRPEVWIAVRDAESAIAEADASDARVASGAALPLHGVVLAIKDNIDVAGMPTTAGSRAYAYDPADDSTAVARLRAAGAIVIGKTNLDQFATGLVGTRSPFGVVRNAWDLERISGGSSAGSAVAVALGIADIALGTDTAGSGRVPAALNGIFGIKPTVGLIPTTGVVPACRTLDCVTVFARDLDLGRRAAEIMTGPDDRDPLAARPTVPVEALGASPRVAVPLPGQLEGLADGWADAFADVVAALAASGVEIVPVDIEPMLEAARLLYGGAFVAERTAAVGDFIAANPHLIGTDLDPSVAAIVTAGRDASAAQYFRDRERLDRLKMESLARLAGTDALLTPTTTWHPTIAQVAADPIGANSRMGRFTNFCNLFDLSALAVPAGFVAGLPFGVMLTGAPFADRVLAQLAPRITRPIALLVVGAHLRGQPLNAQLVAAGGSYVADVQTSGDYRLFALATTPPKPGLVRATEGGAAIPGELWSLPASGFGAFVASLPEPMGIGTVRLDDGRTVPGFMCEAIALEGATEITDYGGWRAYRAAGS